MNHYLVTWEIDAEADSPEAAARWAWEILRKPGSTADVFTVIEENGDRHHVDLSADAEEPDDNPFHPESPEGRAWDRGDRSSIGESDA